MKQDEFYPITFLIRTGFFFRSNYMYLGGMQAPGGCFCFHTLQRRCLRRGF